MEILQPIKSFGIKCVRVWHVLRKPTQKEFKQVSKISAIGILLLGVLGFLISIILKIFIK